MWRILNGFDLTFLSFINQWSQRWPAFDAFVVVLSNSDLVKGGVIIAAVWAAWFCRNKSDQQQNRAYLLSGIFGALLALFVARLLAADMQAHGGLITLDDLQHYKVVEQEPLTGTYHGYGIVTAPNGPVTLNGTLHGRVNADRLTINGNGVLEDSGL